MRCDASAAAIVAGVWRRKYGEVDKEGASPGQCLYYSVQSSERKGSRLVLCFGCSSLLGRQLGSLAREARQGGHHFLGALREPLVVIDTET
jgi:hypothetical protein